MRFFEFTNNSSVESALVNTLNQLRGEADSRGQTSKISFNAVAEIMKNTGYPTFNYDLFKKMYDEGQKLKNVVESRSGEEIFGMTMIVSKGKTILVADTNVQDFPSAQRLANVSKSCVRVARLFGFDPKVAFLSHSTFGKPVSKNTKHVRDAIELLKKEKVDFDFDGEMQPDVALNPIYQEIYPFSKIVGKANILMMPALHSAAISTKLMKVFGGGKLIGPLLIGLGLPIEVAPLRSSTSDILNLASIAAYSSDVIDYSN